MARTLLMRPPTEDQHVTHVPLRLAAPATEDSHVLSLTENERKTILKLIQNLPPLTSPDQIDDALLTRIELLQKQLPERLHRLLVDFRRRPGRTGSVIVRGLPTDPLLCATPADGRPPATKATSVSEYCLLLTMLVLGEPISYWDEKEGALIQNICPVRGQESKQENTGSNVFLEFHVEDGFHPYKPDYLGLYCLRADHEGVAQTTTASIRDVMDKLPWTAVEMLRQPLFRLRRSPSFKGDQTLGPPLPVLTGHMLAPDLCIDHFLMEAMTPAASWALSLLKNELLGVVESHALVSGDLLIVDNRIAAHGRTAFSPKYDGHDRWLQRMFVVRDLRTSSASRAIGGHQCVPLIVEEAAVR
jgi:L-asparagine oxygenase